MSKSEIDLENNWGWLADDNNLFIIVDGRWNAIKTDDAGEGSSGQRFKQHVPGFKEDTFYFP
jgi:hypothetical protein